VKEFATGHIRNVALVAHHGVGKTTLAEAMLFQAKATTRIGRIADGSTMLDHSPEEISRQITIDLGLAQFEFQGHKINLLDTPGYADFVGDVYSALRVADSAILVLRAATGVEVGTEVVWEVLKQERTPLLVVVNMMDKEHANFDAAVRSCHDRLGLNAVPVQLPIGEADKFHGVVDLIENKAFAFSGRGAEEKSSEVPIPAELKDKAAKARATLLEEAATGDEQLMEKFLGSGDLTVEEIRKGLCERVVMCDLAPVFCCSAALNLGVKEVLEEVVDVLPSPLDVHPQRAIGENGAAGIEVKPDAGSPAAATVFKTLAEAHLGELSLIRLWSGHVEPGKDLVNTTRGRSEKLGTLYNLCGKERTDCRGVAAGDIVAAVKLRETHTGDTLTEKARPMRLAPPDFPLPVAAECIRAKNKGDEEKMAVGLNRLHEEDPTLSRYFEESTKESIVQGMGDLHLEILVERMKKRFGVEVVLSKPHVPYRETIKGRAEGEYRHKKQTGGRGQFGEVHLRVAPLPRGAKFEVRGRGEGRRDPAQLHPRRGEGRRLRDGTRAARRLPGRGRQVDRVLRQVPRRRQLGDGVQDRRRDLLPRGDPQGDADPARALLGPRRARPGGVPRRRDGRPVEQARQDPRHRVRRSLRPDQGEGADGGDVQVRHAPARDHAGPRALPGASSRTMKRSRASWRTR
jgi:elongation factor G